METITNTLSYISIRNQESISLSKIPILTYGKFSTEVIQLMKEPQVHCVNYFAYPDGEILKFICCLADDKASDIKVFSHELPKREKMQLTSITREVYAFHIYEREITENFGVEFIYSPWPKPVRYAFNRADRSKVVNDYPFYKIQSEELHEVGVGPIHAGVIEPGHFRFLCNGETVLHLEIQLGWQHRGIEDLFLKKSALIQRTVLSESIAGDTAVGHAATFAGLIESLAGISIQDRLNIERTIGLELERIAMHIGDLSNMCIGLAYQLGASVFGALRTPTINYSQLWCGNRFGKGLIRIGGTHYPLNVSLVEALEKYLNNFERRFITMAEKMFSLSSVLMRLENIGTVTKTQMSLIGAVGMSARMTGIERDVRKSHPTGAYQKLPYAPVFDISTGDVWARAALRRKEIVASIDYIRELISMLKTNNETPAKPLFEDNIKLSSNLLSVSLIEGWRGEICHCAITNDQGKIQHYKIKDPSVHNWMALALSLRDLEISDFPINNKSYNLSYCGHDL
ncbi:MAG: NADH dehydrogenase subunit [Bacteroidia bacterium]|nr:NADH dehydrogenase subunit [Bacteroidia bacterium]